MSSSKAVDLQTEYQAISDTENQKKTQIQVAIELGCCKSTISN